jgi:hypothetical protein
MGRLLQFYCIRSTRKSSLCVDVQVGSRSAPKQVCTQHYCQSQVCTSKCRTKSAPHSGRLFAPPPQIPEKNNMTCRQVIHRKLEGLRGSSPQNSLRTGLHTCACFCSPMPSGHTHTFFSRHALFTIWFVCHLSKCTGGREIDLGMCREMIDLFGYIRRRHVSKTVSRQRWSSGGHVLSSLSARSGGRYTVHSRLRSAVVPF